MKQHSGAIIQDPQSGYVLLQYRSAEAPTNPHKWGLFGGAVEADETPQIAVQRELSEELSVNIDMQNERPLIELDNKDGIQRHIFLIRSLSRDMRLILNEGERCEWIAPEQVFSYDLTPTTEKVLRQYLQDN